MCVPKMRYYLLFLVSGRGFACQQEISLFLAKTLPIPLLGRDG